MRRGSCLERGGLVSVIIKDVAVVRRVANEIGQLGGEGSSVGVRTVRDAGHIAIDLEGEHAVARLEHNAALDGLACRRRDGIPVDVEAA